MFSQQYQTLDELVADGGLETIKQEFNNYWWYCNGLRAVNMMAALLGKPRITTIGLVVHTEGGREKVRYMSFNDASGRIERIVIGFDDADVIVSARESDLLAILSAFPQIKKQAVPLQAAQQYAPCFSIHKSPLGTSAGQYCHLLLRYLRTMNPSANP